MKKIMSIFLSVLIIINSLFSGNVIFADDEIIEDALNEEVINEVVETENEEDPLLMTYENMEDEEDVVISEETPVVDEELIDEPEIENNEEPITEETHVLNYIDPDIDTSRFTHKKKNDSPILKADFIPDKFSLVDEGKVTSIKNQGDYGTCWAFASVASAESTLISKDNTFKGIDLSELHLAYFAYHNLYKSDPLNLITNDGTKMSGEDTLQEGGNYYVSSLTLASGLGMIYDYYSPYYDAESYIDGDTKGVYCYDSNYRLKEAKWLNMSEKDLIKKYLMENGAIGISYYHDSQYYNASNASYNNDYYADTNHAVTLVGWDDNYSKSKFNEEPLGNGAWLVKNSWGSDWGDDGFFWISYYDASLSNGFATQFFIEYNNTEENHIYQYDGSGSTDSVSLGTSKIEEANIYKTIGNEYLYKVGFFSENSNVNYTVSVYKNVTNNNPKSGTKVASVSGHLDDAGYHTVYLDKVVGLSNNTVFSIVVEQEDMDGSDIYVSADKTRTSGNSYLYYSDHKEGQSFLSSDGYNWDDVGEENNGYNLRIKGITINHPYELMYEKDTLKIGESEIIYPSYTINERMPEYTSSNPDVAIIGQDGVIIALRPGTTTINSTLDDISASITITVKSGNSVPSDLSFKIDEYTNDILVKTSNTTFLQNLYNSSQYNGLILEKDDEKHFINLNTCDNCFKLDTKAKELLIYGTSGNSINLDNGEYTAKILVNNYGLIDITNVYTIKNLVPADVVLDNDGDFFYIKTNNTDYIENITKIKLNDVEFEIGIDHISDNIIKFDCSYFLEKGLHSNSFVVDIYADSYYTKHFTDYYIEIDEKEISPIEVESDETGLNIYSDDVSYLDSLLISKSDISLSFKGNNYLIEKTGLEISEKNNKYCVVIPLASLNNTIPGVNGRQYRVTLNCFGYSVVNKDLEINHLQGKAQDIIYVYVDYAGGKVADKYSEVKEVVRDNKISNLQEPTRANYQFEGWLLLDNTVFDVTENINTDKDLYIKANFTPTNTTSVPVASISTGSPINIKDRIALSCSTYNSTIKYTTDGSDPKEFGLIYDDEIIVNTNQSTFTIKAYAYSNGHKDSDVVTFEYTINEEDLSEIDLNDKDYYLSNHFTGLWTSEIPTSVDYTGKAITFDFNVYDHNKLLTIKKDYTVSYKNNTNAGAASLTITGKGNYHGTLVKTFNIEPLDISDALADSILLVYKQNKIQKGVPKVTYTLNGTNITLKNNKDYTLVYDYSKNYSDPGDYTITIQGKGNYKSTLDVDEKIVVGTLVSSLKVSIPNVNYNGQNQEPEPVIKNGKNELSLDLFDLNYSNNKEIGTATLKISAKSDTNYFGSKQFTFKINGQSLAKAKVSGIENIEYSGSNIVQNNLKLVLNKEELTLNEDYEVLYDNNKEIGTASLTIKGINAYTGTIKKTFKITGKAFSEKNNIIVYGFMPSLPYIGEESKQNITVKDNGETLVENTDYELEYSNNVNASKNKAVLNIVGLGKYTGKIKKTYSIYAKDIIDLLPSELSDLHYKKGGVKPSLIIVDNEKELILNKDYTVKYEKNNALSSAKNKPAVTITGKGNYKGSKKIFFNIIPAELSTCKIEVKDKTYSTKAKAYKTTFTIKDDGVALKAGSDYLKDPVYSYANYTVLDNGTVRLAGSLVNDNDIIPVDTLINVKVTGKGCYSGELIGSYRIVASDIAKAKISIPSQYYTGEAIKISKNEITISVGNDYLTNNDFEIVNYKNNINKGKATITIKGIGKYGGIKTANFSIVNKEFASIAIMLFGNNPTSGKMKDIYTTYDNITLPINTYKKKGYTFVGWKKDLKCDDITYDCGNLDLTNTKPGSTIKLFAVWQKDLYTITYNYNGGNSVTNPASYSVDSDTITLLNPTRNGYTFTGWYNGKKKVTTIAKGSTGDVNLVANWKIEKYKINYVLNGGKLSNKKAPTTYDYNSLIQLDIPTRVGYSFISWYKNNTTKISQILPGSYGNIELNAKWKANTYYISFNGNGINEAALPKMTCLYDNSYTIKASDYQDAALKFKGWNTKPDGSGTMYKNNDVIKNLTSNNNETITLYAQWQMSGVSNIYYYKIGYDRTNIYWFDIDGVDSYNIYRSTNKTKGYEKVGSISSTHIYNELIDYYDHNLTQNKNYYYKITAVKTVAGKTFESEFSNPVVAKTALKPNFKAFLDKYSEADYYYGTGYLYPDLYINNAGSKTLYIHNNIEVCPEGTYEKYTCQIFDAKKGVINDPYWVYISKPDKKWYYNRYFVTIPNDYVSIDYYGHVKFEFDYDDIDYVAYCGVSDHFKNLGGYQNRLESVEYKYDYSN